MQRTTTTALLTLLLLAHAAPATSRAGGLPTALTDARALLLKQDASAAAARLEGELPTVAAADRPALLALLRDSYAQAIREADARGQSRQSADYRENLAILTRKAPAESKPTPPPTLSHPSAGIALPPSPPEAIGRPAEPRATKPVAEAVEAPKKTDGDLAAADRAFRAKDYATAGQLYARLAAAESLPARRQNPWAYCRMAKVVERINGGPADDAEWRSIQDEIAAIRRLSPKNWYAEYLRNLAIERSPNKAPGRGAAPRGDVLRGASPDEPAESAPRGGSTLNLRPTAAAQPEAPRADTPAPRVGQAGTPVGNWRVWDTPNFRILHSDDVLAEQVARHAENARELQIHRWTGSPSTAPWTPRCDIYLYPTSALFQQQTGQDANSPGFSTMGMNSGRIVARRVNLRADHANLLPAILPHEVTHVVLADLFSTQQIPRWADEGMAVLAEPASEQDLRAADLEKPLATGELFRLADLMVMDYPDGRYWALYYAQSVSLTRFLVDQGSPMQFVEFVRNAQQKGADAELRRIYKIQGLDDLQSRWISHVKSRASTLARADADIPTPDRAGQPALRRAE